MCGEKKPPKQAVWKKTQIMFFSGSLKMAGIHQSQCCGCFGEERKRNYVNN